MDRSLNNKRFESREEDHVVALNAIIVYHGFSSCAAGINTHFNDHGRLEGANDSSLSLHRRNGFDDVKIDRAVTAHNNVSFANNGNGNRAIPYHNSFNINYVSHLVCTNQAIIIYMDHVLC